MLRLVLVGIIATAIWSETGWASVPDPASSTIPTGIVLVGQHEGVPDPGGTFTVTVRDFAFNPLAGAFVTVDFSNCSDIWPASAQNFPGLAVDCVLKTVRATTNAAGTATFVIVGSVLDRAPASMGACAQIRANAGTGEVALGNTRVAALDQDGVDGAGPNDFSLFECDFGCFPLCPPGIPSRSDYNFDGSYTAADLALAADLLIREPSSSTGPRCDGQASNKPTLISGNGGLNVAWNACITDGGVNLRTSTCLLNTGSQSLVFSVVAPSGVTDVTHFEAEVLVISRDATPLPDWWRFDACRSGTGGVASFTGAVDCEFLEPAILDRQMFHPYVQPSAARVRVAGGLGGTFDIALGVETILFSMTVNNSSTIGTGACAGCSQPMVIVFESLKLIRSAGCTDPSAKGAPLAAPDDVLITQAAISDRAYWQAVFTDVGPVRADLGLALARSDENPARGALGVVFTLANGDAASLDLFDAAGRRVESHEVGSLGAGGHRLTLGADRALKPGLYFVRLRQSGASRYLKATVTR